MLARQPVQKLTLKQGASATHRYTMVRRVLANEQIPAGENMIQIPIGV